MSALSFAIRGHSELFCRDVAHGADFRLENATVQDFLEDVAEYHETQCGCLVNIGSHVWIVTVSLDEAAMRDEPPAVQDALSLQTRLDSLRGPHLSLLIDGVALEFGANEFLRLSREKSFIPFSYGAGTVFRRSGSKVTLPSENVPSYNSLCATPGSVFVDKSAFVRALLDKFISSRVNIIRRPRGFGKTTFLSMVDAYFDPQSPSAHFPFIFEPELVSKSLFAARRQMLVFAMDFARLSLHEDLHEDDDMDKTKDRNEQEVLGEREDENDDEDMFEGEYMSEDESMDGCNCVSTYVSAEAMDDRCYAFLDDAARNFYTRYEHILRGRMEAEAQGEIIPTFADIVHWSKQEDYSLVFLIDNYTAPLLHQSDPRVKHAIARTIFDRFADLAKGSRVSYGFLVGEDIPGAEDWAGMPERWQDLSHSPDLTEAIGFTEPEVVALGQAISVDLLPALQSSLPADQRGNKKLLYSPADVLSVARMIKSGLPSRTMSVRTFIPTTVEDVPRITLAEWIIEVLSVSDSWPEVPKVFDGEKIDVHTGFPDDDDDDEMHGSPNSNDLFEAADSSWEGRRPPLTIDRSSENSSSSSSSGSSAGGEKKPVVILGDLESPVHGYPLKKLKHEHDIL